jgi:hypothetical protein
MINRNTPICIFSSKHVIVTPPGSADCVFLDICRVSHQKVQHSVYFLKKEKKIK